MGFVLGAGIAGIDLDHCADPATGALAAWACQIVERFPTYAEWSPSRRGVHLLLHGRVARGRRRGPLEVYSGARFFAMTGWRLAGAPLELRDHQRELDALLTDLAAAGSAWGDSALGKPEGREDREEERELAERLAHASWSTPAVVARFWRLWRGRWAGWFPSQSEADLALCRYLTRLANSDAALVDRWFRRSGLWREKWDERRGSSTYGEQTIARCLELQPVGRWRPAPWSSRRLKHPSWLRRRSRACQAREIPRPWTGARSPMPPRPSGLSRPDGSCFVRSQASSPRRRPSRRGCGLGSWPPASSRASPAPPKRANRRSFLRC